MDNFEQFLFSRKWILISFSVVLIIAFGHEMFQKYFVQPQVLKQIDLLSDSFWKILPPSDEEQIQYDGVWSGGESYHRNNASYFTNFSFTSTTEVEVFEYFDTRLIENGWRPRQDYQAADLKDRPLYYCKNNIMAEVQYFDPEETIWSYKIRMLWGIDDRECRFVGNQQFRIIDTVLVSFLILSLFLPITPEILFAFHQGETYQQLSVRYRKDRLSEKYPLIMLWLNRSIVILVVIFAIGSWLWGLKYIWIK